MNVFYVSYQLTQTHLQAAASCNMYENPLAQSPLWDGCCPVRPGPERGCNRQRQTESRCRTPGNSDPHTGTRSRTRTLRWATGGSTIPLNVHTSFEYVLFINLVYFVMNGSLADYHGDQVAKPLVSQLVSDDQRHPLLGWWAGVFGVDEKRRLPGRKNKEKEMYFWSVIMFPSVTLPEVIKWNQGASGRGRKTNSACCRWWSPDRWQCVWLSDQLLNRH